MRDLTAHPAYPLIAVVLTGVLLGCAYPPIGPGLIVCVALAPLLLLMPRLSPARTYWAAFAAGLFFHAITVSWIRHITTVGMVAAVIVLSLIFALPFLLARVVQTRWPVAGSLVLPCAVAGIEWARSFDVLAFPWVIMGNTMTPYPRLIQFADVTSAFGVSWWIVMVNVAVVSLIRRRTIPRAALLILLFAVPAGYSAWVMRDTGNSEPELRVALIQGNVSPEEKWSYDNAEWNIDLYVSMSIEAAAEKPDIIIWPETATPVYLCETPGYRRIVQSLADSLDVLVFTGTPSIGRTTGEIWNAACLFAPGSSETFQYKKIRLVPFGEAIPLHTIFPALKSLDLGQANWDSGGEYTVFSIPGLPAFNGVICFESIFPDFVRQFIVRGSQFIVVITNDVWFGPWASPIQHAMISVMRAIEFHRPVARCANTGISMIIDRYGRIQGRTDTFVRDYLVGNIQPNDALTFYARYGNIFSILCLIITIAVPAAAVIRSRTERQQFLHEKTRHSSPFDDLSDSSDHPGR